MKSKFLLSKFALLLVLVLGTVGIAYSQNAGTSPQSGTTSQTQSAQSEAQTAPEAGPPQVGETQTAPPAPGVGNTTPSTAPRSVPWGWTIFGFLIGLLVGALAWRRTNVVVREDIRRDRVA